MFTRQKIILNLFREVGKPLTRTSLVKLVFLLKKETVLAKEPGFYDFLPYNYGPFSFGLYNDINKLLFLNLITETGERLTLSQDSIKAVPNINETITQPILNSVKAIVSRYGGLSYSELINSVYGRYPWYAINSEIQSKNIPLPQLLPKAQPEVFTIGYEGKCIDSFLNNLLEQGILTILDIRANPISRKYGFNRRQLSENSKKLGINYHHFPLLGIPSKYRKSLTDSDSYRRLFDYYSSTILPDQSAQIVAVARLMQNSPSVLLCFEQESQYCHRSRLSQAVAAENGLRIADLQ